MENIRICFKNKLKIKKYGIKQPNKDVNHMRRLCLQKLLNKYSIIDFRINMFQLQVNLLFIQQLKKLLKKIPY